MRLIIDIPDGMLEAIKDGTWCGSHKLEIAIRNGIPYKEQPTGEWIYPEPSDKEKGYGGYCSCCKCDMPIFMEDWKQQYCETPYCPNCGSKMKGEER